MLNVEKTRRCEKLSDVAIFGQYGIRLYRLPRLRLAMTDLMLLIIFLPGLVNRINQA